MSTLPKALATIGASALFASTGLSQNHDFLATSPGSPTDWLVGSNWSQGLIPGAPGAGFANFARMTTTDAELDGNWAMSLPGFYPWDYGMGFHTNVAVGFESTNKLTVTSNGFLHTVHEYGMAIGKNAGGHGTLDIAAGGWVLTSGSNGKTTLGLGDPTAQGHVMVSGRLSTHELNLTGAGSTAIFAVGSTFDGPYYETYPGLSVNNGGYVEFNSNHSLGATSISNGLVVSNLGSQTWFREDLTIGPSAFYIGTGGGKVLFDGATEIEGIFSNAGRVDLRVDDSLTLGPKALFADIEDRLWLRNGTELIFEVDASGNNAVVAGSVLGYDIYFGSTPALTVNFESPPASGGSYVLMSGINAFKNYDGTKHGFEFGTETVTGLAPSQEFDVVYDVTAGQLVLEVSDAIFSDLGQGLGGSLGEPVLTASGAMTPGNFLFTNLSGAQPSAMTFFVAGFSDISMPLFGGTLVPNPTILLTTATDVFGEANLSAIFPGPGVPAGISLYIQCGVLDATAPQGIAFSNAILAITQ